MKKRDIEILSQKSSTHQQTLAKEAAETNEMKSAIASLSAQRDAHLATNAQHLDSQSRFNIPELEFWTSNLCLDIEGAGMNDHLKFIFTHVDDRDWTREAWFELDTSKREYEIPYCKPKMEKEQIERVLEKLNESRDLGILLKGMRELFVEAMKS
jgi:kinetochore protein Spc25